MSSPPPIERRNLPRRAADRVVDDLQKTFSLPFCRSCLERTSYGVLLLDQDKRVVYSSPQAELIASKSNLPVTLEPKFNLHVPHQALRFASFTECHSHEIGPLCLLLGDEFGRTPVLMTCYRFPKLVESDTKVATYVITLRDPNQFSVEQWRQFVEEFNLTPAEARLCRTLAGGQTLSDYCEKWKVTSGTARSQLHNVFGKTSTCRQSDLLRLIFLFTLV